MSNLREIKAAMPAEFASRFKDQAESLGMTSRQLAATCIALGFKAFCKLPVSESLPSEPSPVATGIAEKAAVSRGSEGAEA